MKKLPIGLVIEGNSTSSTLLRLSAIASELGPIKSSGLAVARRVSNFLRGGYGVRDYSELRNAKTILIRVPDASIDRVVAEICDANLLWTEHSFMLCETWMPTEKLEPLRNRGSGIASLVALPTGPDKTFVLEGDVSLVRQIRRIVERANVRNVELRPGTKHLLFAATALCSALPVPLLVIAQQLLRDCGISGNQLSGIIEHISVEMLSGFLKGARTTWGGPLAELLKSTKGDYWNHLDETHPQLANTLRDLIESSRHQMPAKLSRGQNA